MSIQIQNSSTHMANGAAFALVWIYIAFIGGLLVWPPCNCISQESMRLLLEVKDHWEDYEGHLSNWNNSTAHHHSCNWAGVVCDNSNESVVGLQLSSMNIHGTIPSTILCRLGTLTFLNLDNNYFGGEFPPGMSACSRLQRLDFSQNQFVGTLPDDIYRLGQLTYLDLSANNFSGDIPAGFGLLQRIQVLFLHSNLLNGTVPAFLGNLSTLLNLTLAYNPLQPGMIPGELGRLTRLRQLWLTQCNLRGRISDSLGNLRDIQSLDLSINHLNGSLPGSLMALSNLTDLVLYSNNLSGEIPANIGSLKRLLSIDLSMNRLTGNIPQGIADLSQLKFLYLYENRLSGRIPSGLGELPSLIRLRLFDNDLTGELPSSIGARSNLVELDVSSNALWGPVPGNVCRGGALEGLILFSNQFNGSLPKSLGNCSTLLSVQIHGNRLSGEIPLGLWASPRLQALRLKNNSFEGQIPPEIAGAANLSLLEMDNNRFKGKLPAEIGNLINLRVFRASANNFSGPVPIQLTGLGLLTALFLDHNMLSGELPERIISWASLSQLDLGNNRFSGRIPASFGSLEALNSLDLSNNLLYGRIPLELDHLRLSFLNLSGNLLSGPVPTDYNNLAYNESFLGNLGLCGGGALRLPSCFYNKHMASESASQKHLSRLAVGLLAVAGVVCLAGLASLYQTYRHFAPAKSSRPSLYLTGFTWAEFNQSDILKRLTEENVIGTGGAGKVYKVMLANGSTVAVKKFWNGLQDKEFGAEVGTLGNIRHVNIVKLLCGISSTDTKLLVYEYMPNGSLFDCLHSSRDQILLDWPTRYKIALGAAQGLSYLHHDCSPPIVHGDVKSNNILLDLEFKAHISDFGLARTVRKLGQEDPISIVAGSYGCIAPEYAYTLKVNEKSDIYSFGVVLLELVTGKKPIEAEFGDNMDMVRWIHKQTQNENAMQEVLDSEVAHSYIEEMMQMLRVGLLCTSTLPINRPSMREVVEMLRLCSPDEKCRKSESTSAVLPHLNRNPSVFGFMSGGTSSSIVCSTNISTGNTCSIDA